MIPILEKTVAGFVICIKKFKLKMDTGRSIGDYLFFVVEKTQLSIVKNCPPFDINLVE